MTQPEATGVEMLDQGAMKAAELAWTGDSRLGLYPEQKQALANATHAYLSAVPTPAVDGLDHIPDTGKMVDGLEVVAKERATHLLSWLDQAYTHCRYGSQDWCEGYLRNAVDVIRSQDAQISNLSSLIQRLAEENAALRFAHKSMADFVRPRIPGDQNPEQAESYLAWIGMIVRLEERGDKAMARAETAEEALRPFAEHIDEMKFDLDNKGNELPDDQSVGWVYVTNGDFRRARRALSSTEGDGK